MVGITNNRQHNRTPIQITTRCGFLYNHTPTFSPRLQYRPIISNISYGGLRLNFIPALDSTTLQGLITGKINVYLEFALPPSVKPLSVTCKVKWTMTRIYRENRVTVLGLEYVLKTPELFQAILQLEKAVTPSSALYKERRFFPRVPLDHPIEFAIEGVKRWGILPRKWNARINNLSAKGLQLRLLEPLNEKITRLLKQHSKHLNLKINFLDGAFPLKVQSRPVHIQENLHLEKDTLLGLKFLNLDEASTTRLIEYLLVKRENFLREEVLSPQAQMG